MRGNRNDNADEAGYDIVSLFSDRWDIGFSEVGFLINLNYGKSGGRTDNSLFIVHDELGGEFPGAPADGFIFPRVVFGAIAQREPETLNITSSLQWSPTDNLELYAELFYADFTIANFRQGYGFILFNNDAIRANFNDNDVFSNVTRGAGDQVLTADVAEGFFEANGFSAPRFEESINFAIGGGVSVGNVSYSGEAAFYSSDGGADFYGPERYLSAPGVAAPFGIDVRDSNAPTVQTTFNATNPANLIANIASNNHSDTDSDEFTVRGDVELKVIWGSVSALQAGIRYASFEREARNLTGALSLGQRRPGSGPVAIDNPAAPDLLSQIDGTFNRYISARVTDYRSRPEINAGMAADGMVLEPNGLGADDPARWGHERANTWYAAQDWPVGFNYIPRYAINQLEIWQADTFNPKIIVQELGWAADIGFNTARVFLYNLPWSDDRDVFIDRIDQYLTIAASHNIKTIFVLFNDVWGPRSLIDQQRQPIPHTHNSGWLQAPGKDILGTLSRHDELRDYVEGIVGQYRSDPRVLFRGIYNEPTNTNRDAYGLVALPGKSHFSLQLINSGVWQFDGQHQRWSRNELFQFMTSSSDIITFRSYAGSDGVALALAYLQENYQRPIICTEYIARQTGSRFQTILPIFVQDKVGAINWGLVSGKSQTIYPWNSWTETFFQEPDPWFHDILRADGSPYSAAEVEFLRKIIANKMATWR